ncbi:MAG: NAD-dependent epimerase/dehydratase [Frankiales bacterium]|jgi:CDP-paratose 2-epimerase|nr:NAD-dependent epimerase/dehydratase [Frankiales bacterium]
MRTTLVTGGAGFIGTNMADRLLSQGERVVVLDDLSRIGVENNLSWLRATHPDRLQVEVGDVQDAAVVRRALQGVDQVFHFAAQVAVTTSVTDPVADYGVNLGGTVTLLEELRRLDDAPPLLFTSTNKVYGKCKGIEVVERGDRYEPSDEAVRTYGIGEDQPLQFASPYGCSKGGADQYVLDYADTYGMPTVVFRMSCIYGPHQCGNEDQGWVAHFLMQALDGNPITLYGDGRQVRDVLFVDDLLDAMQTAMDRVDELSGSAFNMGGGPDSTVSLLQLLDMIGDLGARPDVEFGPWRVGDQRYYVSDTRRFSDATGWAPKIAPEQGVALLHEWLTSSRLAASRAS